MLDTKKITEQEVEILLDSLDFYEKIKNSDEMEYSKMREAAEVIESQLKRQINDENIEEEGIINILQGINNYKKEMLLREKEAILNRKINREKITLLKAKLILLQQDKAIESVFKNN